MAINFRRYARAHPDAPVIEATDARQGRWGRHVFWVLVFSTVLAVIALFSSWAFRADDLADADARTSPAPAEVSTTGG